VRNVEDDAEEDDDGPAKRVGRLEEALTAQITRTEVQARLRVGLPVFVREGSTERNLEPILQGLLASRLAGHPSDTHNLMFCTDDKHPDDVLAEGHIDFMVRQAIRMGLPAVEAVRMATLNAAQHFRLEGQVGSLSPGRWADILLVDDLETLSIHAVYVRGELKAQDGALVGGLPTVTYPDWFHHTVKTLRGRSAADFRLAAPAGDAERGDRVRVRVIELYPDQIINRRGEAFLPVRDGVVCPDLAQDVLKLSVVERHGKNGNIGTAFVRGFGLQRGAVASSVAHDHHNIIVAGVDDESMAACVRAVEDAQGGLAVAAGGEVLGLLPLPLGGLMSDRPAAEVIRELGKLNQITRSLGGALPAPFMTISFIGLPTVPEYGLTDKGLVDVRRHELIDLFL
jgi:adenine deaminase